jgi:hypothetical protein
MDATDDTSKATRPEPVTAPQTDGAPGASNPASDRPFGRTPPRSTSHHDDERGLAASYLLARSHGGGLAWWRRFLANTPTVVGTVDAAIAAAIVVLAVRAAEATTTVVVAAGTVAFLVVWTALFALERHALDPLRRTTPRFPTPPDEA